MVLTYSLLVPLSGNGSQIKNPISGCDLSCGESRRAARGRLRGRSGPPCEKTGWQVQAYCLMSNHFHLVIETPQANLVSGMKWLLGTYTSGYNRRTKGFGHLFSGRYKFLMVDGSQSGYLKTVCDYV